MMRNDLMNKAIEAVLKVNDLQLGSEVSFKLVSCPNNYCGEYGIFHLYVIRDTVDARSTYQYLLKWDEEEDRFLTSSKF